MAFLNICGPILANTVYADNVLVAKDVSVTLPEVAPMTADIEAMGTMSIPMWQRIEDMETAITKIGIDKGLGRMIKGSKIAIEVRFVQQITLADGNTKEVGCKAFLTLLPKVIPGIELAVGEASENEVTATTIRYQLYADGEEMWCIDRLSSICRIGGTDYGAAIQKYL